MDIKQGIKVMIASEGITQNELGERMGLTTGNMSRLINKGDFRVKADLKKVGEAAGFDVKIIMTNRKTSTSAECEP